MSFRIISFSFLLFTLLGSCKKEKEESFVINKDQLPTEAGFKAQNTLNLHIDKIPGGHVTAICEFSNGKIYGVNESTFGSPREVCSESKSENEQSIQMSIKWVPMEPGNCNFSVRLVNERTEVLHSFNHIINVAGAIQLTFLGDDPLLISPDQSSAEIAVRNDENYTQKMFYHSNTPWLKVEYPLNYSDNYLRGGIDLRTGSSHAVKLKIMPDKAYSGENVADVFFSYFPKGDELSFKAKIDVIENSELMITTERRDFFNWGESNSDDLYIHKEGMGTLQWSYESNANFQLVPESGDITIEGQSIELQLNPAKLITNQGGIIEDSIRFTINEKRNKAFGINIYNYGIYQEFAEDDSKTIPEAAEYVIGAQNTKVVIVGYDNYLPKELLPASIDEVQVIGTLEKEWRLIQSCTYGGGIYEIGRMRHRAVLNLYNARTHELILTKNFYGTHPTECPSKSSSSGTYRGGEVNDSQIIDYISNAL